MKLTTILLSGLATLGIFAWVGNIAAAPSPAEVVKARQNTMKEQGADLKRIKDYLDGKGDLAAVRKSAADLTRTTRKIPELFPKGTDMAPPGGKFRPKPVVWTEWDKFLAAQKNAVEKAEGLDAAAKTGDKPKIAAAFADLGKHGCGACHQAFREKIQ